MTTPPGPADESDDLSGSVSVWLDELKGGHPDAASRLWARYFRRMTQYTKHRLWGSERVVTDEEDVALSAFKSFCRGAAIGRFPAVLDRDRLWNLLVCIMARKASKQIAHERCQKRGGRAARGDEMILNEAVSPDLGPDLAAQMADEFRSLLDRLPDPSLRAVAVFRLEGYTSEEIAEQLGLGVRTVERKLVVIRQLWSQEEA